MVASKDTRKAAARKRATVRAQERTRRTMRTPGAVKESGVAAYSAVRLAQAAAKNLARGGKTSKGRPVKTKTVTGPFGQEVLRTRAVTRAQGQLRRADQSSVKPLKREWQSRISKGSTGKAPSKPSARSNSAKYRGRKNK